MLTCHLYNFFGEMSVQVFLAHCLIKSLFFLLNFKSSLHILDHSPLSHVSFTNGSSQSVASLLILLVLSFTEQKFLILMKPSLSVISFMNHVFGVVSKKASPYPRSSKFSPMLSSRSFIV